MLAANDPLTFLHYGGVVAHDDQADRQITSHVKCIIIVLYKVFFFVCSGFFVSVCVWANVDANVNFKLELQSHN